MEVSDEVEVAPAQGNPGWDITWRGVPERATRLPTKKEAVAEATRQLRETPNGGRLIIYYADGRPQSDRILQGTLRAGATTVPAPEPQGHAGAASQVIAFAEELKSVDKALSHIEKGIAVLAIIAGPLVSAAVKDPVRDAVSDGSVAVFLATLTFCLGVAIATTMVSLYGWAAQSAYWILASFFVSLSVATWVGTGVLGIESTLTQPGLSAPQRIIGIVETAIATYGWAGMLISLFVGWRLGRFVAKRVSAAGPDQTGS